MRRIEDWLALLEREGGPEALLRPRETARERAAPLKEALGLAARTLGGETEVLVVRSTGRINLMGMHIDHRGGSVNPIAIKDLFAVVKPREDDIVRAFNVEPGFESREFSIAAEAPPPGTTDWDSWTHAEHVKRKDKGIAGDWSNYVRAPVVYVRFAEPERALRGMDLFIASNLPKASGLSSSSAVVVATATAFSEVNGLGYDDMKLVEVCGIGEWYVGTRGGRGDHAAIIFGKIESVSHLGSFPLTVAHVPLPEGYSIVLANSLVEAKKTENARDVFNQRVACYELGLLLLKNRDALVRERAERLRDLAPGRLGCSEADVYRLLKLLPEEAARGDLAALLKDDECLARILRSHSDVGPYRLRQVVAFGVAECVRSEMALESLKKGDIRRFGELINISHEGDRVSRNGASLHPRLADAVIDRLIADLESGVEERVEQARLWRLPGWYEVSCPELDDLVDIARACNGVVGAGRVGAGLGGAGVVLVESAAADALLEALSTQYYAPRGLPVSAERVRPLDGAAVLDTEI